MSDTLVITPMPVPEEAKQLAMRFEGFHRVNPSTGLAHPYLCPAGYWTIGYGHLCESTHPPITHEMGLTYLERDLEVAQRATLRFCPGLVHESPQRRAAIIDFVFNLGAGRLQTSTLRKKINQAKWDEAAEQLRRWVFGGGKKLPGLVARREAEVLLLLRS